MPPKSRAGDLPIVLERGAASRTAALYDALRDAILRGRLGPSVRLPATRDLAHQLDVARGTVVAAYAQLAAEGYVTGRHGSGTYVSAQLPDRWFESTTSRRATRSARAPALPLSRFGRELQGSPFLRGTARAARPFRPHVPAVDAFPSEVWTRLATRRLRRDEQLLLADVDVRGYAPLRALLAEHLRVARGVVCSPDQLVIVPSAQQVLDLIGRLTLDPGDVVWMEDPGYVGARAVFSALGATLVGVPVDAQGMDVAHAVARAPRARLVYVTPGRQAPLGVTLAIERRVALLAWARAHGALVIEDDYDSEYRYEGRPVPALQGLDASGVVVHVGSFSKTLLPSLRLAYAVIPDALLDRFLAAKSIVDRYTPPLAQAVLADFVEQGHFGRHLRRMRELYGERRAALLSALTRTLDGALDVTGASAGLDLALRLPPGTRDHALVEPLAARGVEALPLSAYALDGRAASGLILGFAPYSPARLRRSVDLLASVLVPRR